MVENQRYSFLFKALATLVIIVVWSCGQRGAPGGGASDTTPPQVIKSIPDSCATNFNGTEISWKFDEYVKADGLNNALLISPPIKGKPKFKLVGKKLILKFDTLFNKNTTYSVFLGEGVKDINEGNPLEDNLLVFSTGDVIDSLSFHGEIVDGKTMKTLTSGMVHLYKMPYDSIPSKEIPSYFAKINNGHFHFNNLAEGDYLLFALVDNNNNYLYDLPSEKIAFNSSIIKVNGTPDSNEITLKAFIPADTKQFIKGSRINFNGKIELEFNQTVNDFNISILGKQFKKDWKIEEWDENRDSLILWSSEILSMDSLKLIVEYDGNKDTLKFNIANRKSIAEMELTAEHDFGNSGQYFKRKLGFNFSQPISSYDTSKFILVSVKDTNNASVTQVGKELKRFTLNNNLLEENIYALKLLPKAVKTIFGVHNEDTLTIGFSTAKSTSFGNLNIKYNFSQIGKQGVFQVYLEDKLIDELIVDDKPNKYKIEGGKPGNYRLKYILDENGDDEWTPGNYWTKTQPEKVFWYNEKITLRANWDLDVDWVLTDSE